MESKKTNRSELSFHHQPTLEMEIISTERKHEMHQEKGKIALLEDSDLLRLARNEDI